MRLTMRLFNVFKTKALKILFIRLKLILKHWNLSIVKTELFLFIFILNYFIPECPFNWKPVKNLRATTQKPNTSDTEKMG